MSTTSININHVPANSIVYVSGIAEYSRIASHIEGEELAADNMRKASKGMKGTDKPHTRFTINHASVDYADPQNPTLAEQFIAERLYDSPAHPEKGKCYTGMNKSRNLPEVYCRENAMSTQLERISSPGEVLNGVPVTLAVRFFKATQNNGVSLDSVIINEKPVRWYGESAVRQSLRDRGFQIVDSDENNASPAEISAQLEDTTYVAPTPAPAPTPTPVSTVPPVATPYAQPAPAPTAPAAAAPVSPARPIPPAGYEYDANGRIVPIGSTGGIKL